LVYDELRAVARYHLRAERPDHTLSATGLVHEAYLRLARQDRVRVEDRGQFLSIAGHTMRRVLVDWARAKKRQKRGGGQVPLPLDAVQLPLSDQEVEEVLALDEALDRLSEVNRRGAEVVEHRFFAGLTLEEIAALQGVSTRTVRRDWVAARAWLRKEVERDLQI
jgi:RNA polymerase sigma factor (TIGR02999 family)